MSRSDTGNPTDASRSPQARQGFVARHDPGSWFRKPPPNNSDLERRNYVFRVILAGFLVLNLFFGALVLGAFWTSHDTPTVLLGATAVLASIGLAALLLRRGHLRSAASLVGAGILLAVAHDIARQGPNSVAVLALVVPTLLMGLVLSTRAAILTALVSTLVFAGAKMLHTYAPLPSEDLRLTVGYSITLIVTVLIGVSLMVWLSHSLLQREIAERARAEAALREANVQLIEIDRRRNEFLAMLSHELRNPLMPIRNSLFILDRVPPGSEKACRAKEIIDRQVRHLAHMVDDLLDVNRIARGKVDLKRERFDLNELARHTVEDHRPTFEASDIELEWQPASTKLWVHGDRTRLAQVIGNLLQNAARFTPRGGKSRVSTAADPANGQAVLHVQDTGQGICPEVLPHLFEPFAQADTTMDRSKGGLGLGLAIVKGVVEMHGGVVNATSHGLGKGATFAITLPLATTNPAAPSTRSDAARTESRRILVIEDNVDAANSLREALELAGHVVAVANCGSQGIAEVRDFEPDIVFCDIGLPDMSGYAVARELRALTEKLEGFTLIALSGYARPQDVAKAIQAGFDGHLPKPPSMDALQEVIAKLPRTG